MARGTSIRFDLDSDLKGKFQTLCNIKQTSMTDALTRFIETEVKKGQTLIELVETAQSDEANQ